MKGFPARLNDRLRKNSTHPKDDEHEHMFLSSGLPDVPCTGSCSVFLFLSLPQESHTQIHLPTSNVLSLSLFSAQKIDSPCSYDLFLFCCRILAQIDITSHDVSVFLSSKIYILFKDPRLTIRHQNNTLKQVSIQTICQRMDVCGPLL